MICETCQTKFNKCTYCNMRRECLDAAAGAPCHIKQVHIACPVCEPAAPPVYLAPDKPEIPKPEVLSERTLVP